MIDSRAYSKRNDRIAGERGHTLIVDSPSEIDRELEKDGLITIQEEFPGYRLTSTPAGLRSAS